MKIEFLSIQKIIVKKSRGQKIVVLKKVIQNWSQGSKRLPEQLC